MGDTWLHILLEGDAEMAKAIAKLTNDYHKFPKGTVLLYEVSETEKGVTWYSFRWPDGSLVYLKAYEFTWGL